jgi:trimethylamine monooxygenase
LRAVDLVNQADIEETFDYVVIATGHFSVPNVPSFEGIDCFPGRVIHGHEFRDAVEFRGQRLLIVGASYSAEDIALQCRKYGAASVTCSYRTGAMGFNWPDGIEELPLIDRFEGNVVHFSNGEIREIDAVILCTGYLHHFPFLSEDLRLATHNRLYPGDLYKGVFWINNPKLMYLGMQDQYYTFSMFDAQAWYARDAILGRIKLPGESDMRTDVEIWQCREEALEDPIQDIDFQTDYCKDLSEKVDYSLNWDLAADNFKRWEHHKEESIVGYRNHSHPSPVTGTLAPAHHTPWWEAMDDSAESFLGKS